MDKEHDKIATRLALILNKLNSGEKFTVDDLVHEFNVTKRTIQRDLNERFSYLPLKKENGFYSLEAYCLGKLNFEDIKSFAILSGIKELYPTLNDSFIIDILNTKINQSCLVKGNSYEKISTKTNEFELIGLAIVEKKQIIFTYKNKSRTINPYKLVNTDAIWYLVGDEDGTLKNYSFTKISELTTTDNFFKHSEEFASTIQKNEAVWFSQTIIEVILEVDISVSDYFLRRQLLPYQTTIKKTKEKLTLSTKVSYDEEILKVARYWVPHIKIISPEYLQEKLENGLREYLNKDL
ncbi:MAG: WYL domain-containing protein [Campylobacterales bacterium]|nr:WYL domain-containing protein [Campylobacterales bacterium]